MHSLRLPVVSTLLQSPVVFLIALLSCAVSLVLTVNFCYELRSGDGAILLAATGIIWELAKYNYAPTGLRFILSGSPARQVGGSALCLLSLVLVTGSIVASLGYLVDSDRAQQEKKLAESFAYHDLQTQLGSVDQQITLLTKTASADIASNYRKRALETSEEIRSLRGDRKRLEDRLQRLEGHSENISGFFVGLGSLFSGDASANATRIRFISHAVVAVMLELIGIAALSLLRTPAESRRISRIAAAPGDDFIVGHECKADSFASDTNASQPCIDFDATQSTSNADTHGRGDTGVRDGIGTRYGRAKHLITSAQIEPTYRSLQRALQLSQGTAQRFLKAMQDEGLLRRVGRRYQVDDATASLASIYAEAR